MIQRFKMEASRLYCLAKQETKYDSTGKDVYIKWSHYEYLQRCF